MKSILITGFEPFHLASQNPSQAIIEAISELPLIGVNTLLLPVTFGESSRILIETINRIKPDVVIMLGQAEGRTSITPEMIAINLDDARIADNAGNQPHNQAISADGPDGIFSTLDLDVIVSELRSKSIPSTISYSAGTFVCNHLFYSIQRYGLGKNFRSGFIHVPLMESQKEEFPGLPTMPLEMMVDAVKATINTYR